MSKPVLMSIQPKWCQLIIIGKKTIEIRKSRPKLEMPFKVYIYCTKDKKYFGDAQGKVIGEFLCEAVEKYPYNRNGYGLKQEKFLCFLSCLESLELYRYLQGATPYAWYISDLVIYDTPKDLSEFGKAKAPQSWCYVDETK